MKKGNKNRKENKYFKRLVIFAIAATMCLSALTLLPTVSAAPINVPGDYPTIQQAIDAAISGNTIIVAAGTYYENIVIHESIILVGEDKETTIIDGSGTGDVVTITADDVTIRGFTMTGLSPASICKLIWAHKSGAQTLGLLFSSQTNTGCS